MNYKVFMSEIKLYNDDCLNVLKNMNDDIIDLVVTSPPYDNLRDYNNSSTWNFEIFKNIAKELVRIKRGRCYCLGSR